jgi:ankyrin repeat protein
LIAASRKQWPELAKILIDHGADVTLHDNAGDDALSAAVYGGKPDMVDVVMNKVQQFDLEDRKKMLRNMEWKLATLGSPASVRMREWLAQLQADRTGL